MASKRRKPTAYDSSSSSSTTTTTSSISVELFDDAENDDGLVIYDLTDLNNSFEEIRERIVI